MDREPARAWVLNAVRLPDGAARAPLWIEGGRIVAGPLPHAVPLPGRFVAPGLMDAHAHLGMDFSRTGLPAGGAALIQANRAARLAAGLLALRDLGEVPGTDLAALTAGPLRVVRCGRLLAPPGRFHEAAFVPVPAEELIRAALAQVEAGLPWVKVIADFPGPDMNFFAAPPTYEPALLAQLVVRVHAAGGRVAVHSTGPALPAFVAAGVDSVEHGNAMTEELVREMADRGIPWTPTIGTAERYVGHLADQPGPVGDIVREWRERITRCVALAERVGLPVLAGSDELPHDRLADEVGWLARRGLSPRAALAAATTAPRRAFGLRGLEIGAPADLVTWEEDPREELGRVGRPDQVLIGGEALGVGQPQAAMQRPPAPGADHFPPAIPSSTPPNNPAVPRSARGAGRR